MYEATCVHIHVCLRIRTYDCEYVRTCIYMFAYCLECADTHSCVHVYMHPQCLVEYIH